MESCTSTRFSIRPNISHLRMPSFEHLIRRVQRASRGDFLDQQRFRQIIENASFAQHDAEDSEVEDTWLRDHFSLPPVIEM